ncbi:cell division control protein Cdc6 [Karstenula rhodostoma CBS 690.94]|uniref:Cell division control protein n=1 Tax=Karstenula rhodostoma CBS 690.94 TaxID=1392251 RepID=A0A9P4U7K8_9PLEO|nr:cell division control protein Cdc6 [Karstenula rhodostoma CBS 690.94]
MPATVLGKRTRSSAAGTAFDAPSTVSTRAKRRAQFVILDEGENDNPFVTSRKKSGRDGDATDVEQPSGKRMTRAAATTPAKHDAHNIRIPLSPTKANSPKKAPAASPEKPPATPSTPRHQDVLASKVAVTPRHRLVGAGRPLTPRTPHTPTTTTAAAVAAPRNAALTLYNDARQLFVRGSAPTALFGRETERDELQAFISSRIDSNTSGCMYISGPPGTGKSAFVNEACREIITSKPVKSGYVNCMSVKNPVDLYRTLLDEFVDITQIAEGEEVDTLEKIFMQRDTPYLVTLDEVDHLLELDTDLLYSIFEWSLQDTSSLVLVGIANALDFTDRFLPRLKARGLKPHLLPFLPYTAAQISSVITSKLKSLVSDETDFIPFLHPNAIMFLSKKVASQTGDLRKAFDICRRAIDLVEADTRNHHARKMDEITPAPTPSPSKTPLVENMNLSSPVIRTPTKTGAKSALATSLNQLTALSAPRATIAYMARITATVFSNGATQRLKNLNLQQKAVLCSLSALEKTRRTSSEENVFDSSSKAHSTAPTVKELFETYTAICKGEQKLHPLTSTEFRDIVGSLETLSLISAVEGKAGSLAAANTPSSKCKLGFGGASAEDRSIASCLDANEISGGLVGPASDILKGILGGDEAACTD